MVGTFSQPERVEQFLLKLNIWKILLAIRVVLFLLLVVHGVESNPGPRKRGTRARDRLPNRLSDSVYPERKLENRSGAEHFSKSSNGSNTTETEQRRHTHARFQAVTVSLELHNSKRPSETQSQPPTERQHQPPSQAQPQSSSQAQSQPSSRIESQPLSQRQPQSKHPSQALSQPPIQTQFHPPSPAELQPQSHAHSQPLNPLTPAETARDNVDSSVLLDIRSKLKGIDDMLQRLAKDHRDTSALLNCGIEELRQKADGLESRLQKLDGENEQLGTQLRNGNPTLHGTEKNNEKQGKVLITEDNFARSYDPQVYKAKKQDSIEKSKNCCNMMEHKAGDVIRVESIKMEGTDYCFDEIVFKDESNPTENMLPESFSIEDIKDTSKFFNNRPGDQNFG